MKKWIKFFCLGFFTHKISKEGAKRGYTNFILGLILTIVFLWAGYVGGDMLPFGAHYDHSPDFQATVRAVLANPDIDKRISVEIQESFLRVKNYDGEYTETLFVNTFENDTDRQNYSVGGYNVVIDSRPADTLAEVEAYCVSNDGRNLIIPYEEYLSLSDVAKLNFDFKLKYTGNALTLNDSLVETYRVYLDGQNSEIKLETEKLASDLSENKITNSEYNRAIYELFFVNYYPEITVYESTSKVPLLRNYYYHRYIKEGTNKYLFVFDDYMAGSFETGSGINHSFYGFYSDVENGVLIAEGVGQEEANKKADSFLKKSYGSIAPLSMYAYAMNIFTLIPFIALIPMVVAMLAYSILKLRGIESITSLGAVFKIIGSYVWFSGLISAVLTVIIAFFVQRNILAALPLVLFFITLATRSIMFVIKEAKTYIKQCLETAN